MDSLPLAMRLTPSMPLRLDRYPPVKIMYGNHVPVETVLQAGRQVSKSVTQANVQVLRAVTVDGYKILTVMPLFSQVTRFSADYVSAAVKYFSARDCVVDNDCDNNVLRRTFSNASRLYYSYAWNSCDRIRGVPADELNVDEVQDINYDFIPIMKQCLQASPVRTCRYSGTPKTDDHAINVIWQRSSGGEWVIPCRSCRHENVPALDHDIFNMIGRWNDEHRTGLKCAKCGYPITTYDGRYVHKYPERIAGCMGLHWPQIIFPIHCGAKRLWNMFLSEYNTSTQAVVYNELLGIPYNKGARLITRSDIEAASVLPWYNETPDTRETLEILIKRGHVVRTLGIDWGGHGEDGDSVTALAVVGMTGDGVIETLYMDELTPQDNEDEEFARIKYLYGKYGCRLVAHDYNGVGVSKDAHLRSAGYPRIFRWSFVTGNAKYLMAVSQDQQRLVHFKLNRTAALRLAANLVKTRRLVFPKKYTSGNIALPGSYERYHLPYRMTSWFENYVRTEKGTTPKSF